MDPEPPTEESSGPEGSGPGNGGKRYLIAAAIIAVTIIIILISAAALLQSPAGGNTALPSATATTQSQTSTATWNVTGTSPASTVTPTATPDVPVAFVLRTDEPASCGLTCRELDATITNTGYATAHDVCITLVIVNSDGEVININGEESITRCVGDLEGGESKTEHVTIDADCGSWASKCLGQTLTLQTRVSSEELSGRFADQVMVV